MAFPYPVARPRTTIANVNLKTWINTGWVSVLMRSNRTVSRVKRLRFLGKRFDEIKGRELELAQDLKALVRQKTKFKQKFQFYRLFDGERGQARLVLHSFK